MHQSDARNQPSVQDVFVDVLRRLEIGEPLFGKRLFVVGSDVGGAISRIVSLDGSGASVLLVVLSALRPGAAGDIADELDRIAQLGPAAVVGGRGERDLGDDHGRFFGISGEARPGLNHDQEVVVVVEQEPDIGGWEELLIEVGGQLTGVYLLRDGDYISLDIPHELRRKERPRVRFRSLLSAAAAALVLAAVLVLALRWRSVQELASPPSVSAPAVVRDAAAGVPGGATHNQWIGQDHLVRASDGSLLAVFAAPQGLQVVADNADYGRTWRPPVTLSGVGATSVSTDIDGEDRLHVAFSDGSRVAYVSVEKRGETWVSGRVVELDGRAGTPYVDVAYDDAAGVAHVVWVGEEPQGQAPRWGAVGRGEDRPRVLSARALAPAATDIPVLVNVAAGPGSSAVATYRRGDAPLGWFARSLAAGKGFRWGPQERVPTKEGIGAADLAVDSAGVAHLVVRDSTSFALVYFTRTPDGTWSRGETAVDAERIEEIDFPSLTVDRSSPVVYLFFQSDRAQGVTGVQVGVRSPVGGWQPPFPAATDAAVPEGALFPASLEESTGAPIVLWTRGGGAPTLQAAVIAP